MAPKWVGPSLILLDPDPDLAELGTAVDNTRGRHGRSGRCRVTDAQNQLPGARREFQTKVEAQLVASRIEAVSIYSMPAY